MTRERAIDLCRAIDQYLCAGNPIWDTGQIHEAMKMATEALSDVPDTNVGDMISRQAAVDAISKDIMGGLNYEHILRELPSAEPEIIYCKDCKKYNMDWGVQQDGTVIAFVEACPLIMFRGIAQGHEYDYQYCAFAERKEDE